SSSARFGAASPTQLCERFRTSSRDDGGRDEPASETIGRHSVPRCRQRHPQRRRLQPSPRSRLAEDHFARHPTRATPDLHNSASPQTGFLTGDYPIVRKILYVITPPASAGNRSLNL